MIRLMITDDHAIMREGLKQLFALAGDLQVVAEAENGAVLLERLRQDGIDLLLLDMSMPGISGEDLLFRIHAHHPQLPILVLSMHNEVPIVQRALRAGASGYLTKDRDPETLLVAIRRVAAGGRYIDAGLAEQIAFAASGLGPHSQHDVLTDREQQVMRLLVRGLNVTRVAAALAINHKTVSTHKARLMEKRGGRQRGRYRPLCHSPPAVLAMLARDHIDRLPYPARIAPTQKSASTDSCRIYIAASFAPQLP